MENLRPAVEHLSAIPVLKGNESPLRINLARVITKGKHGSELTLGVAWLEPGQVSRWWSFEQDDQKRPDESFQGWHHETYFVVRGRLKLSWNEGELDLAPNDAVYLAPGWHYRLENVGDDQAFFVYNVYPTTK